jgi:PAS domain S-box-containing protein
MPGAACPGVLVDDLPPPRRRPFHAMRKPGFVDEIKRVLVGASGSLGRRATILTIAFSSLIMLMISLVQLSLEYRELRGNLDRELDGINIFVQSVSGSLWSYDEKQIELALHGILRLPHIEQVTVVALNNGQTWEAANLSGKQGLARSYDLYGSTLGQTTVIGKLVVVASLDTLYQQIALRALAIVAANGLKSLLVALFMLMLFRRLVTYRLEAMAHKVRALSPLLARADGPSPGGAVAPPKTLDELDALGWTLDCTTAELRRAATEREAAQTSLREAQERFRTLVEHAPEAILVYDAELDAFMDANPKAEQLFGCDRAALLGGPVGRFVLPEQPEGVPWEAIRLENQARVMAGETRTLERHVRTADGRALVCEVSLVRLPHVSRRLIRVSLVDVTQRRRDEAAILSLNRRLQGLLDAALEVAIIATDLKGQVTVFNRGAERMLGYAVHEVLGGSAARFHRDSELLQRAQELSRLWGRPVKGLEAVVALAGTGQSELRNWTYVDKGGKELYVSLAVSAVHDDQGTVIGYLGIARDISSQLAAEAKLIQLNLQLDHRVHERTQELRASTEQLQRTLDNLRQTQHKLVQSEKLAALGSIVAAVSHELNTPIGNCLTVASTMEGNNEAFAKLLAGGAIGRSQLDAFLQDTCTATQLLMRGLQRAAELVTGFKQVAVNQSGSERRKFALKGAIGGVVALLNTSLRTTPYRLEIDIPLALTMDSYPGAIEQVLSHLVNNSILHGFAGRPHGLMRLQASGDSQSIRIIYSDDGRGMSAAVVQHIFDPFFTTLLGQGRNGLGMSICYNLVTGVLGGSIELESSEGHGCRFTLTLPRTAPQRAVSPTRALPIPGPDPGFN